MRSGNWLQHTLRRSPLRFQRQAVALTALSLFVGIIIGALYLAQAASIATTGRQLEALIAQRNQLEQTNEQLRVDIAGYQTVARLLARANELGFVSAPTDRIEYLVISGYNPNRTQVVVREDVEEEPVPTYDESFVGWLQQQWDSFSNQYNSFVQSEESEP